MSQGGLSLTEVCQLCEAAFSMSLPTPVRVLLWVRLGSIGVCKSKLSSVACTVLGADQHLFANMKEHGVLAAGMGDPSTACGVPNSQPPVGRTDQQAIGGTAVSVM